MIFIAILVDHLSSTSGKEKRQESMAGDVPELLMGRRFSGVVTGTGQVGESNDSCGMRLFIL